jgi:ABC-type sugar transport system ATPase subunit
MAALRFHADPWLRMETQEGNDEEIAQKCAQIGTPREIYESPANTYVAARLGQPTI